MPFSRNGVCAYRLAGIGRPASEAPTQVQSDILNCISASISQFGAPDPQLTDAGALTALCKVGPRYSNSNGPVPFGQSLTSWPVAGSVPVPLEQLVSGAALSNLRTGTQSMLRPICDVESVRQSVGVARPYSDPNHISDGASYGRFVCGLKKCGMVDIRSHCKHTVGIFFVRKKNGSQRIIFDTRLANSSFLEPPAVRLPTAECYAGLEIGEATQLSFTDGDIKTPFTMF
jgi:hypothetical protein